MRAHSARTDSSGGNVGKLGNQSEWRGGVFVYLYESRREFVLLSIFLYSFIGEGLEHYCNITQNVFFLK